MFNLHITIQDSSNIKGLPGSLGLTRVRLKKFVNLSLENQIVLGERMQESHI